jgi:hypothetical protein
MSDLDFGADLSTFQGAEGAIDCDPLGPPMTGPRVALEGIARRLSTPAGALAHAGLPNYGFDLMALAGKRMSPIAVARAQARIADEASKEQGVIGVTATITALSLTAFHVSLSVRLADGPYTLVLSVSDVSVAVLRADRG